MARLVLALFLAVCVLGSTTYGYEFQSAKRYMSRIFDKASGFIGKQVATEPPEYLTEDPENAPTDCNEDGMFPLAGRCGSFVHCLNGVSDIIPCLYGQHYNSKTRRCEDPCSAHCDDSMACDCEWDSCQDESSDEDTTEGPSKKFYQSINRFTCSKDGLYPNPMDCTKYIQCSNGLSYVMSCPSGLHFSTESERCESPCVAKCDPTISCKWKSSQKSTFKHPHHQFTCVKDGLYPNPENCSTYIECSNGHEYVMPCPEGLHFSEETERCESPCDAHCDLSLACECEWDTCSTTEESSGTEDNDYNIEDFRAFSKKPYKLKVKFTCSKDGLYPNPMDCTKYIQCSNGHSYVMSCPTGLHFSNKTERCESPCVAQCDPTIQCKWRKFKKAFLKPTLDKFRCNQNGLYPNPEDCGSFIQCSNGQKFVTACPDELHYSEETERCEVPCDAYCDPAKADECGWEDSTTHEGDVNICRLPVDKGICRAYIERYYFDSNEGRCKTFIYGGCRGNANNFKTEKECYEKCLRRDSKHYFANSKARTDYRCVKDGLFPNPENCGSYIECSNGNANVMPCPEKLHFSQETQRCESPCDAHCDPTIAEECEWESREYAIVKQDFTCIRDGLYSNPEDCGTYIQCSNGQSYVMSCPKDLHFCDKVDRCETPCDAHCDETIAEECRWDEGEFSMKHSEYDYVCVKDGLYKNPEDCATYIQCSNGNAYVMPCPKGLHFSEETQRCESPCDAHCDPTIGECKDEERSNRRRFPLPRRNSLKQSFTCNKDGLYPDPEGCTSYIQCANGQSYVMPCPEDLHFSQETQRCESPCDAHCDPTIAKVCGWEINAYSQRKPEYDFACDQDGVYQNPKDCNSYIQCRDQQAYVESCPYGLQYSEDTKTCVEPCDANCDPSYAADCGWDKPWSSRQDWELPTISYDRSPWTESSSLAYDITCIKDGIYRNPENCTTYIQCSNGHSYVMPCPGGLHFSEETQRCESPCEAHCNSSLACACNWPECNTVNNLRTDDDVDCEDEPYTGPCEARIPRYYYDVEIGRCKVFFYGGCEGNTNNFETESECRNKCQEKLLGGFRCPAYTGKFGHYPDCISYYNCKRGIPTLKRCPKGQAFDHKKSKCVTEFEASCVYECREPDAVYPYEEDCHKYIDCVNGVAKLERCPRGKAFDPTERDCVDEKMASSCAWQ